MRSRLALAAAAASAIALAGCDSASTRNPSETEAAPKAAPDSAEAAASIIRPEVMAEQEVEPALAPLEATIPFPDGGFGLGTEAERALDELLASDQLAEDWPIVLRGHTDSVGHDEANLRVSRRRAEAVAEWLIEHGVSEQRIEIVALGEQRPIAPNALPDGRPDERGRAKNRRVTLSTAPPAAGADGPAAESQSAAEG